MTDKEKAIVMAYTGVSMLSGEKFSVYHKYIEDILGRPVWTHELASETVWNEIKEKSKPDFLKLCADEPEGHMRPHNTGEWIREDEVRSKCSLCGFKYADYRILFDYCPNCGAEMRGGAENG